MTESDPISCIESTGEFHVFSDETNLIGTTSTFSLTAEMANWPHTVNSGADAVTLEG